MPRTITYKVYSFRELSEAAKEKAIQWYREKFDDREPAWAEENRQSMEAFAEVFPVKVRKWQYDQSNGFVAFDFTGEDAVEALTGQRLATYIWNNYGTRLFKGKYYSTTFKPHVKDAEHPAGLSYKHRHSNIMLEGMNCVLTGYCMDDDLLEPIYKFLDHPDGRDFRELLQDCFDQWVSACVKDYEYQGSDEYIAETLEANDYEFKHNGSRACV